MWFIYSLFVIAAWGITDFFYKKSVSEKDDISHLNVLIGVGVVMGIHALYQIFLLKTPYSINDFIVYLPVSFLYILAMALGFYGFRFIELSVASPLENTSGAIAALLSFLILGQTMELYQATAVVLITVSIVILGTEERKKKLALEENKRGRHWFLVILFPLLYALIDSLGTFADTFVLEKYLGEDQANISYELTFFILAIIIFIYITLILKRKYILREQKYPYLAGIFETIGQYFYVHALGERAILVAPMIASYSAIAIILGRILLKEKLTLLQKMAILVIMISIFILGME